MVRLQKYIAEAGVASRRAAETLIAEGRIMVNGRVIRELGTKVDPDHDKISMDGLLLRVKKKIYVAVHKPVRYLCSKQAEKPGDNRKLITELLPPEWQHVVPVGRLDYDSEGLIFLTNDGDFCLKLTHPRYGVIKTYVVDVEGKVEAPLIAKFLAGIEHEGEMLKAHKAQILTATNSHSIVEVMLAEGKNREVRRLFESAGLSVIRLIRTQIGKIKLGELKSGKWRALTDSEIKSLLPAL